MKEQWTNNSASGRYSSLDRRDEIVQTSSVTYLEADLKLTHLRILMTIIGHLQTVIRFKAYRARRTSAVPENFLPPRYIHPAIGSVRKMTIPLADFRMGSHNVSHLRAYFDELMRTRIIFPSTRSSGPCPDNVFPGLIAGYHLPEYARQVDIYLLEPVVRRLLLTEEGFTSYSKSAVWSISNKYTVRLYWLLCSWRSRGGFVMTLGTLRRILCLGPSYERTDNLVSKIIIRAEEEFRTNFPIWFEFKLSGQGSERQVAFRIRYLVSEQEADAKRQEAWSFCHELLSQAGIRTTVLDDIIGRLYPEDVAPFSAKTAEVIAYIRRHRGVKDAEAYLRTSVIQWQEAWAERFCRIEDAPAD